LPGPDELRAQALAVARGWSPPGAPQSWRLTAALFEAIAVQDDLLDRLAALPADRLPALLASAAIAFLVRRDRPVPLVGYFPEAGAPQPRFDDRFFPADFQRRVAKDRLGVDADLRPGGHLIALANPSRVAEYLLADG